MIYLISNGRMYSDHRLLFVESDFARELIEGLAKACFGEEAKLLGEAQDIRWQGEHLAMGWETFVQEESWQFFDADDLEDGLKRVPAQHRGPVRDLIRQIVKEIR
jgi:hypothetical protein